MVYRHKDTTSYTELNQAEKKMATITQTISQPRTRLSNSLSIQTFDYSDTSRVRYLFVEGMRSLIVPIVWSVLFHPIFFGLLVTVCTALAVSFSLRVVAVVLLFVMAALYLYAYWVFYQYTKWCLSDDLADIEKVYIKNSRSHFWTAELNGQVVGIVGVEEKSKDVAELRRMSVDSSARGRGIAQTLLLKLIAFCRYHGYKEITLDTTTLQKPAIRLYIKNGFEFYNIINFYPTFGNNFYRLKL